MAIGATLITCCLPLVLVLVLLHSRAAAAQPLPINGPGSWIIHSPNSGVSAMHMNILPVTNHVIMYDATIFGASAVKLTDQQGCRMLDPANNVQDCWAHSVNYDSVNAKVLPLKVNTDTWCSSGSLTPDGTLISVGGNKEGAKSVRFMSPCDVNCVWREYPDTLADPRWYATQTVLADNRFIIVGGRGAFSYEYMPLEGQKNNKPFFFPFLKETTEVDENNLYPFVHLSSDGNVFIFANNRSVMFNPLTNSIVREFPQLDGGARNYPASGMSAILPIRLDLVQNAKTNIPIEVLVCGGALHEAYREAGRQNFLVALDDCNRIEITNPNPTWVKEKMPSPRTMGDMLHLPTGDIIMIGGAKRGTSAWDYAEDPNFTPVLYKPDAPPGTRFTELAPTTIARMYHSSSIVLPDTTVLVGGSNTHDIYRYDAKYPTELRIEKFSPPYLDQSLRRYRPEIDVTQNDMKVTYSTRFKVMFKIEDQVVELNNLRATMYSPSFSTHGVNMNQRLLVLEIKELTKKQKNNEAIYSIRVRSPPTPQVAPAGYYIFSITNRGVPSEGLWVQLK